MEKLFCLSANKKHIVNINSNIIIMMKNIRKILFANSKAY